jgi:beta-phosphoglucomutase-like phosphatase (HAD superfamily)
MDQLLTSILDNNLPYAIVTNTSRAVVTWMQQRLPLLAKLHNWVTKDDYSKGKPCPKCYQIAIEKYRQNAKYVVGFENTWNGLQSIRSVTNVVYMITNKDSPSYPRLKKEDVYLLKEYSIDI